jgi:DNA transposition AAA+ family ATPase
MTPYTPEKNKHALLPEAAVNNAAIDEIREYIARSGLSGTEFARRIGYSYSALYYFQRGSYEQVAGSGRHIREAAQKFMAANPIAPPTMVQGELYDTENVRTIRRVIEEMTQPKPTAMMIYAPPGSQKSFTIKYSVADFNRAEMPKNGKGRRAYYVYARENIRPRDIMKRIAAACGTPGSSNVDDTLNALRWEFRNRRVLLILDEAQHLSLQCLEVIRELYDEAPHFSLLLVGSHDLRNTFDRYSASLSQWNSRIAQKTCLPGLVRTEADGIVRRELAAYLGKMNEGQIKVLVDKLIADSTEKDVYENNRKYINIRTLTNALDALKAKLAPAMEAAHA